MRVGRASHRKPEAQGNQRELGEPGGPDGPEGTSGRRKPDAWLPEEPEEEQPAQAGGSTEGRDEGRDARRKLRRSAGEKPETEIYSRCEIVNDEGARDFGLWRFRFNSDVEVAYFWSGIIVCSYTRTSGSGPTLIRPRYGLSSATMR